MALDPGKITVSDALAGQRNAEPPKIASRSIEGVFERGAIPGSAFPGELRSDTGAGPQGVFEGKPLEEAPAGEAKPAAKAGEDGRPAPKPGEEQNADGSPKGWMKDGKPLAGEFVSKVDFDKRTRELRERERELDRLRKGGAPAGQAQVFKPGEEPWKGELQAMPRQEDFDSTEAFLDRRDAVRDHNREAERAWRATNERAAADTAKQQQDADAEAEERAREYATVHLPSALKSLGLAADDSTPEALTAAAATFNAVLNKPYELGVQIDFKGRDAMVGSWLGNNVDNPALAAYDLATAATDMELRQYLTRVGGLSDNGLERELVKMAGNLAHGLRIDGKPRGGAPPATQQREARTSAAPRPPAQVSGGASSIPKDVSKMTTAERLAHWRETDPVIPKRRPIQRA